MREICESCSSSLQGAVSTLRTSIYAICDIPLCLVSASATAGGMEVLVATTPPGPSMALACDWHQSIC